jgi:hypothetical protein
VKETTITTENNTDVTFEIDFEVGQDSQGTQIPSVRNIGARETLNLVA